LKREGIVRLEVKLRKEDGSLVRNVSGVSGFGADRVNPFELGT